MSQAEDTIEVDVPVRFAYDQWTRFREFPEFMDGIESVERLDGQTLLWVATVAGRRKTWRSKIVELTPDVRVAWRSDDRTNDGDVLFRSRGLDRTIVTLRLEGEPEGPMEAIGMPYGSVARTVRANLRRFKRFVEDQSVPPGPWRGLPDGRGQIHRTRPDALAGR